jgi:caffeoyl-CoA O-methyltransferase
MLFRPAEVGFRSEWPDLPQVWKFRKALLVAQRTFVVFAALATVLAFATIAGSTILSAQQPAVRQLLAQIKSADTNLLAVSEEDGRFLRAMVTASNAKEALEIGGANGYSAIWIGLGLRETGGHLTSIEYDPARATEEAENIRKAGLADIVTVVAGDAFKEIPKVQGTFDFVFLDAWKRDYKAFYDMVFPRLRPHGVFLAHNVVNKQREMRDFLAAIQNSAQAFSSIVTPSGEGMSVTVKVEGKQ